jgi:hypothetical protein
MRSISRIATRRLSLAVLCAIFFVPQFHAQVKQLSIRHVDVLGGKNAVEIQVEASDRIAPQAQVLTNPDRLVVDFPNAVPGRDLRSQSVYRGQVKDLRIGLFQSKPPVTRIVLDLNSAQSYQIFPGQMVIIKVMNAPDALPTVADYPEPTGRSGLITANYVASTDRVAVSSVRSNATGADVPLVETPHAQPARATAHVAPAPAPKPFDVSFSNGLLTVHSNKATLSEILFAVQQRTGAEVAIAAGAEQEKVVVDLGPAPAPEVLAQLLNGSKFNFLILSSANDARQLDRVILSPRVEGYVQPPPPPSPQSNQPDDTADEEPAPPAPHPAPVQPPSQSLGAHMPGPGQTPPQMPPDTKPDDNPQNQ